MCASIECGVQVAEDAALALRSQEEDHHTARVELSTAAEAQAACVVGPPGVGQAEDGSSPT